MKIVCIGDSFTAGYGVNRKECWLNLLQESLPDHIFINKGINGDTTGGMLARFENDVISEKPRYVLIMGGVNDFISGAPVSSVQSNIMSMVHQAYHSSIIPILGIEPECIPDKARRDWAAYTDFKMVLKKQQELQQWGIKFSETFKVYCIDLFEEFPKRTGEALLYKYYLDGLHLTPAGHELIFDIVHDAFHAAVRKRDL